MSKKLTNKQKKKKTEKKGNSLRSKHRTLSGWKCKRVFQREKKTNQMKTSPGACSRICLALFASQGIKYPPSLLFVSIQIRFVPIHRILHGVGRGLSRLTAPYNENNILLPVDLFYPAACFLQPLYHEQGLLGAEIPQDNILPHNSSYNSILIHDTRASGPHLVTTSCHTHEI